MKTTAAEAYSKNRAEVSALLDLINQELRRADEDAKAKPQDWSNAESLGYVKGRLIEILAFISPFEENEIRENLEELKNLK